MRGRETNGALNRVYDTTHTSLIWFNLRVFLFSFFVSFLSISSALEGKKNDFNSKIVYASSSRVCVCVLLVDLKCIHRSRSIRSNESHSIMNVNVCSVGFVNGLLLALYEKYKNSVDSILKEIKSGGKVTPGN